MSGSADPVDLGGGAQRAGHRVKDRRVPRDALAHARASPDDDERRRLQSRQQLVEIVVARREAGDRLAPVIELFEPAEADLEQIVNGRHRVRHPPLGDVVHHRLGAIDGLRDVVRHAVPELGDLPCDADQPSQEGVLLDDVRVSAGVRDRGRRRLQVDEHRGPADGVEQVRASQLLRDGDGIDRLARAVQRRDRLEDVPVGRLVEVLTRDDLDARARSRTPTATSRREAKPPHRGCGAGLDRPLLAAEESREIRRPLAVTLAVRTCGSLVDKCHLSVDEWGRAWGRPCASWAPTWGQLVDARGGAGPDRGRGARTSSRRPRR